MHGDMISISLIILYRKDFSDFSHFPKIILSRRKVSECFQKTAEVFQWKHLFKMFWQTINRHLLVHTKDNINKSNRTVISNSKKIEGMAMSKMERWRVKLCLTGKLDGWTVIQKTNYWTNLLEASAAGVCVALCNNQSAPNTNVSTGYTTVIWRIMSMISPLTSWTLHHRWTSINYVIIRGLKYKDMLPFASFI